MIRTVGLLTLLLIGVFTVGCASTPPPGQWVPLEVEAVHMADVELVPVDPSQSPAAGAEAVCQKGRNQIQHDLVRRLPERLAPVRLLPPDSGERPPGAGELKVSIKDCRLDVDQHGDNFAYYLSMAVHVRLSTPDGVPLHRVLATGDQARVNMPVPTGEFNFAPITHAILGLFRNGQVRAAVEA